MRKFIAMALLGAGAAFFAANAPAQAMTAGSAGVAQAAKNADASNLHEVRKRRWKRHRHYHRHRWHRHRHWHHRRYYRPYYYGGYYPYYRRPRVGIYFGF
ncbi:MAG: hypothetical protein J0H65_01010 [Rhizobiales bacterium]|nr:hypothetical protein [Hyphomicrobiales bacterium]